MWAPVAIIAIISTFFFAMIWAVESDKERTERSNKKLADCANKQGVLARPLISVLIQRKDGGLLKLDAYSEICVKVESIEVINE